MSEMTGAKPAAEMAYESIRAKILSGELEPAARVTETALAKAVGLSRTPVREAMGRLLMEGFLERGTGYSTRVAGVSPEELKPMFDVRVRLESYAAGRAARLATDAEIASLRTLADRMLAHTPPRTPEDFHIISTANEAFHRTIYTAARSPRLVALLSMAVDVGVVARTYFQYSEADLIRSARHHAEITDAIAAHAPAWAESIMTAHVEAAAAAATSGK